MKEYFILINTRETPDGILGNFLGQRGRSKEALLNDVSSLFESYSKNSLMYGWTKEKQAHIYYSLSKTRFSTAKLVKVVDVYAKPCIIDIIE